MDKRLKKRFEDTSFHYKTAIYMIFKFVIKGVERNGDGKMVLLTFISSFFVNGVEEYRAQNKCRASIKTNRHGFFMAKEEKGKDNTIYRFQIAD